MTDFKNTLKRDELEAGFVLTISEEATGNESKFKILSCIGRGGSCLVYKAEISRMINGEENTDTVVVKELYPAGLGIVREGAGSLIIPDESKKEFGAFAESFAKGQKEMSSFFEYYKNQSLPRLFLYGEANNTRYGVSDSGRGRVLSQIDRDTLCLNKAASVMESVCAALNKLHIKNYLYLDCKPDNFFYFTDKDKLESDIYLFDFDTVMKLSDVRSGLSGFCPFSSGWAAPEQIPEADGRYRDPALIGYHTDIYSVGAVFFWLLTGRAPDERDISAVKTDSFDWEKESGLCKGEGSEALALINELERSMLEPDPSVRAESFRHYISVKHLKDKFARLYGLTAGDNNHFTPIHEKLTSIEEKIERKMPDKESQRKKKKVIIAVCAVAAAAAAAAISAGVLITRNAPGTIADQIATYTDEQIVLDGHVIFDLKNADHNYKTGLENWRRLDYNRAIRDMQLGYQTISGISPASDDTPARINNSIGCLYLDMGRYEDAFEHINSALVALRDIHGEDSPEALAAQFSMAQYDHLKGDPFTALKSIQSIADISGYSDDEKSKANKPLAAALLAYQAKIYDELGEFDKAHELYEKELELFDDILQDGKLTKEFAELISDPALSTNERDEYINSLTMALDVYADMGQSYYLSGEHERADEILSNALDIALENVYIGRKNLVTSRLYMMRAKNDSAKPYYSNRAEEDIDIAMRIQKNLFDYEGTYPGLVEVYDVYGDILLKDQGKEYEALHYYSEALELAKASFGENHPKTAEALYHYGLFSQERGYYESAKQYFEAAIDIRKDILGYDHITTAGYLESLGEVLEELGDPSAEEIKAEAQKIFKSKQYTSV